MFDVKRMCRHKNTGSEFYQNISKGYFKKYSGIIVDFLLRIYMF